MNDETPQDNSGVPVDLNVRLGQMSRREAMQWVLAAVASSTLTADVLAQPTARPEVAPNQPSPQENAAKQPGPGAKGYGLDVKLTTNYPPGAFWPLTLSDAQKKTADALADVILPEDEYGPAAAKVGVTAMIDEWISAPYPLQQADRPVINDGLTWLEAESQKRFSKGFADLDDTQKHAICDDICYAKEAKPAFKKGAHFFSRFRSLAAGAYYATTPGWKALGYVGNVPLARFDGPPAAVLEQLGVTQTVK